MGPNHLWGSVQKIMHTLASEAIAPTPRRRSYSPKLKSQVVAQTQMPGASMAGVAVAHGINANIVHRWLRERAGQPPVAPSGFDSSRQTDK